MSTSVNGVKSSEDIKEFYEENLEKFRVSGDGKKATALCPFHDDTNPSLSIDLNTGGFHCFGCGDKGGMSTFKSKMEELGNVPSDNNMPTSSALFNSGKGEEVAVYQYHDENGNVLYEAVRYEPKEYKFRRPDTDPAHDYGSGYIYDMNGVRLVPYNLPEVIKAETVYIVEGEKDVEKLRKKGFVATTNPMGAGKWRADFNQYFTGKNIVIVPDNDEPGRKHADMVLENLFSVVASAKVVELPDLPDKGDVTDWFNNGGKKKQFGKLVKKTKTIKSMAWHWSSRFLVTGSDLIKSDVQVEWLIDKLLPKNSITILHGRGGIGKTWLSLVLADAVSRGKDFMDLPVTKSFVVYVDYENSTAVLTERVKQINAKKVRFWTIGSKKKIPPKLDHKNWEDFKKLSPGLLIFDTLRASQGGDENDSRDMSNILGKLKVLREAGFTIILLHHTPKSNDRTYKGSTAIIDLADHVLSLQRVRKGTGVEVDDDSDDSCYRFGTKDKTRYEPFHIFLEFKPEKGFILTSDPDEETMAKMKALISEFHKDNGRYPNQKTIVEQAKEGLGLSADKTRKLLLKGEGALWSAQKTGQKNALVYKPL